MNKYNAKKTVYKGQKFDSKKEADRYAVLKLLERAGEISDLKRQVRYIVVPAQYENDRLLYRSSTYVADFVYRRAGELVVEDVKGYRKGSAYTTFKIKQKLMYQLYKIKVIES